MNRLVGSSPEPVVQVSQRDKISIVMPMFNSESTVRRSVESVIRQSFENWELIIVDDNSDDKSVNIVEGLSEMDSRVKLVRSYINRGAGETRNIAVSAAEGQYIAFLDADDIWYPNKLETQLGYMQRLIIPLSASNFDIQTEAGISKASSNVPQIVEYQHLLKENVIGCLTAMYDTQYFGKRYFPELRKRQDYALWLELLRDCDSCHVIQEPLACYTRRSGSVSSNKLEMIAWNYRMFRQTQHFSPIRAAYYVGWNVLNRLRKW